MPAPIQRSAYWIFTEAQLHEALDAHFRDHVASGRLDADEADRLRHVVLQFLRSDRLAERRMREGDLTPPDSPGSD